jgi:uncharacterized protein YutE (UPF0331/DUF86 family)
LHQLHGIETSCACENVIVRRYYKAEDDGEYNVLDHHQVTRQAVELQMSSQVMAAGVGWKEPEEVKQ